jgi:hypothetical protein
MQYPGELLQEQHKNKKAINKSQIIIIEKILGKPGTQKVLSLVSGILFLVFGITEREKLGI